MLPERLSKRKRMRTGVLLVALLLLLPGAILWASPGASADSNKDGQIDEWYNTAEGGVFVILRDRNYDGKPDYEVRYDAQNRKVSEKLDFNYDGRMDDFYYYQEGRLVRQEIDTNFDGAVDVWVFLDGVYVLGYERDTDFDGTVDVVKHFGQ
jgi:hypothetical protein